MIYDYCHFINFILYFTYFLRWEFVSGHTFQGAIMEWMHVTSERFQPIRRTPSALKIKVCDAVGNARGSSHAFLFVLLQIFFLGLLMDLAVHTNWNLFQEHSIVQISLAVCIKLSKNSRIRQLLSVDTFVLRASWRAEP